MFKTDSAQRLELMFYGCSGFTELDLGAFITENVGFYDYDQSGKKEVEYSTYQNMMFFDCVRLERINISSYVEPTRSGYLLRG